MANKQAKLASISMPPRAPVPAPGRPPPRHVSWRHAWTTVRHPVAREYFPLPWAWPRANGDRLLAAAACSRVCWRRPRPPQRSACAVPQSVHGRAEAAEPERREPSPVAAGARGRQGLLDLSRRARGYGTGMVWYGRAPRYFTGAVVVPVPFAACAARSSSCGRLCSLFSRCSSVRPSPIIHLPGPRSNPSGSAVA
jgi:hypothetical protein